MRLAPMVTRGAVLGAVVTGLVGAGPRHLSAGPRHLSADTRQLSAGPWQLSAALPRAAVHTGAVVHRLGDVGGGVYAVATRDERLYAGVGRRLYVLSTAGEGPPSIAGTTAVLPAPVRAIELAGDYAIVTLGPAGLGVVDVSRAPAPRLVAVHDLLRSEERDEMTGVGDPVVQALGLAVAGHYAYVAAGWAGLRIVDLAVPRAPTLAGGMRAWRLHTRDVGVFEDVALVASDSDGLFFVDVADAGALDVDEDSFIFFFGAESVETAGPVAYVGMAHSSIMAVDLEQRRIRGEVRLPRASGAVSQVAVHGSQVLAAVDCPGRRDELDACELGREGGLAVLDVSSPLDPEVVSHVALKAGALGLSAAGGRAYVAGRGGGLLEVALPLTAAPRHRALLEPPLPERGAGRLGSTLAVATVGGLVAVDVSAPAPRVVGRFRGTGVTVRLVAGDRFAYRAFDDGGGSSSSGVHVVDLADPAFPRLAAVVNVPATIRDVELTVPHLYIASDGGLRVFDVTAPERPAEIGALRTRRGPRQVRVAGRAAYVLYGECCVDVVDVATPRAPRLLTTIDTGGESMALRDDRLYLASAVRGLTIVDVVDPARPRVLDDQAVHMPATHVATDGAYLWTSICAPGAAQASLCRTDLLTASDEGDPRHLATAPGFAWPYGMGDHVALGALGGGLELARVTEGPRVYAPVAWSRAPARAVDRGATDVQPQGAAVHHGRAVERRARRR